MNEPKRSSKKKENTTADVRMALKLGPTKSNNVANYFKKSSSSVPQTTTTGSRFSTPGASDRSFPKTITPTMRWKCQILFQNCVGIKGFWPIGENSDLIRYCRELEECIFLYCNSNYKQYTLKVSQLAHNLRQNKELLVNKYNVSTLVALDNKHLAEGTKQERQRQQQEEMIKNCRQILSEIDIFADIGSQAVMATCSKCKSSNNIYYDPKQTRGADEGMTLFCTCTACGHKWTIRG